MDAYILAEGRIEHATDAAVVRAAHAAGRRMWLDLGARAPAADALLTETFGLHPLVVEDIWLDRSIPKLEAFEGYRYLVVHGPRRIPEGGQIKLKLWVLDVVFSQTWVVTHHDDPTLGAAIAAQLTHSPRLLADGSAWLVHHILDHVVDRFLPLIDRLGARLDDLENSVLVSAATFEERDLVPVIFGLKRPIQDLCRITSDQRDLLRGLARGGAGTLPAELLPYFRDVSDHFVRVAERAETFREGVLNVLDAHFGVQSNVLNQTMRRLTVISTVMLP